MGGALKVFSSGWRSRKHAALAAAEQEQAERLAYSEAWRHRARQDAVPFGLKAMQSPFEVEIPSDSDKSSPKSSSDVSAKEPVKPLPVQDPTKQEKKETLADIKAAVDLALAENRSSMERPRTPNRIHPAMRDESRGRSQKTDYVPYVLRTSEPQQALQEIDAVYRTPRWFRENSRAPSFTDSAYDEQFPVDSARESPQLTTKTPRSRQPSVDFSLIDKHRQTLAAETGQLSRTKRLTINTGLAAASRRAQSSPRTPPIDFQPPPRIPHKAEARSHSASRVPAATRPDSSGSERPSRKSNMPGVTSFTDFIQHTPPSPTLAFSPTFSPGERQDITNMLDYAFPAEVPQQLEEPFTNEQRIPVSERPYADRPRPSTAEPTRAPLNLAERTPAERTPTERPTERPTANTTQRTYIERPQFGMLGSGPLSPIQSSPIYAEFSNISREPEDTSPRRQSFEKLRANRETVIRGHGTGFEILKPGSLQDKPERVRAPPVSIQNFSRPRQRSTSRGRKLQKRAPSIDSRASSQDDSRDSSTTRKRFSIISLWSRRNSMQL